MWICAWPGHKNKIEPIKSFKSEAKIPIDIAGKYVGQLFPDTVSVDLNKNEIMLKGFGTTWKLIAINSTEYIAEGIHAPLHFVRDKNGQVTDLQYNDLGRSLKKITSTTKK